MTTFSRSTHHQLGLALVGLLSALGSAAIPSMAFAHHPTGGRTPATFVEGLLSGIAHPVIGLDHLAMLLLIGAYCGASRHGVVPIISFVLAGLLGCLAHAARFDLPHVETGIAASLVVLGIAACAISKSSRAATAAVLGVAGLLHGYAYGEAIVGAEAMPLVAYLVGLSLVQVGLASVLMYAAHRWQDRDAFAGRVTLVRIMGVASAVVGVVALAF
jgi:urease accessory protein